MESNRLLRCSLGEYQLKNNLLKQVKSFKELQTLIEFTEFENQIVLEGPYSYTLSWNDITYQGIVNIEFRIPKVFPNEIPELFVEGVPDDFEHINPDGTACVATIGEIISFLANGSTVIEYFEKFIDPFLFSLRWFTDYGTFPFGERQHGGQGLFSFYQTTLNLDKEQYIELVLLVYKNKYRGHRDCICSSKKKIRDCHGKYILPIIKNERLKSLFISEAYMILNEPTKE